MSRTSIGYEMCQYKTMSETWHWHRYVRTCVRPRLGHDIGTLSHVGGLMNI
ncbi:hypothetical protein F383_05391 [Gossypium arboreum]|uniref:Uncharacterized protein n=1 Tax=Gossypium arboreum TaxID=29729 RepID=A0A0B0NMC3_GOSAR|nr:hypothetical protein F383_05391 [Gossypium arboreum]